MFLVIILDKIIIFHILSLSPSFSNWKRGGVVMLSYGQHSMMNMVSTHETDKGGSFAFLVEKQSYTKH